MTRISFASCSCRISPVGPALRTESGADWASRSADANTVRIGGDPGNATHDRLLALPKKCPLELRHRIQEIGGGREFRREQRGELAEDHRGRAPDLMAGELEDTDS